MSPKEKMAQDLGASCELIQIGDRGRLQVPRAILAAVGMKGGKQQRPPMMAELLEPGLVRIHVTADIEAEFRELRDDLLARAQQGDEHAAEALEAFKDRYRPIVMESDGRLCLTKAIEVFLDIEHGGRPAPYLAVGAREGKIEVLNKPRRNARLDAFRDSLRLGD